MSERMRMAELTSKLMGKAYKLGQVDCVKLIMEIISKAGASVAAEWEGFTPENYAKLYERNPEEAQEMLICWATSIGHEIPACRAFTGDLMIAKAKKMIAGHFVLLHAGQDQALIVNDKRGVMLVSLRAYDILKAFRWRAR